ncbi:oxidoreductase [Bacillus gobiensis]|uniref:oxidoreductase n=1 Tax=Bacillus gobiensis TaxID=1441095 RepID=UPI003D198977
MRKKVVLITGASSGMGEATAIRLNKAGYIVYASARRNERMKHLEEQGIHILKMDVTDDVSMVQAIETITNEQGNIDIIVNNAGYGSYGALEDVPMSEAKYQFEVNLFGMARLTQLVLPYMRKNHFGKIVNISSIGGKIYEPLGSWYHSSKYAVEGLSDCLRLEVKDFGIDVIVIEPGGIKTEWGGIAGDNLLKISGNTAYGELAKKYRNFFKDGTGGSEPDLIAKIIEKSISVKRPKTRYAAGFGAKPFLLIRKILSDRLYDRFWMFVVNTIAKNAKSK